MAERGSKSECCDKSGCGDTYQLIRGLNMVLVGIVASYFLEVMRASEGAAPIYVLEGPGSPYFPSTLGASVVIVGSVVLIPMFWDKYFPMLRNGNSCKLPLEVIYSFVALLLPLAALLVVMGPFEWHGALGLRARYVAAIYISAALPIVALRLHRKRQQCPKALPPRGR
jgi:hypothetical protein